ncbi:MAG: hypothetical protein FJZ60_02830, partial [Chlamydiae bacterium]|nr:hypothetical protein [Chlamydiota bacterium]
MDISLGDHVKFVTEITDLQIHYLDALYEIILSKPGEDINGILGSFVTSEEISSILYLKTDPSGLICIASSLPELVGKNFSGEIDLNKIDTLNRKSFIARDESGAYALYLIRLIKDKRSNLITGAVALSTAMPLLLKEVAGFGTIRYLETTLLSMSGDVLATTYQNWVGKTFLINKNE